MTTETGGSKLPALRRASVALEKFAVSMNAADTIKRYQALQSNASFRNVLGTLDNRLQQFRSRRIGTGASSKRKFLKRNKGSPLGVEKLLADLARVKRKLGGSSEYLTEKELMNALGPDIGPELALEILHFYGEEAPSSMPRTVSMDRLSGPSAIESLRREQQQLRQEMAQVGLSDVAAFLTDRLSKPRLLSPQMMATMSNLASSMGELKSAFLGSGSSGNVRVSNVPSVTGGPQGVGRRSGQLSRASPRRSETFQSIPGAVDVDNLGSISD